jgi:hypothetical protein
MTSPVAGTEIVDTGRVIGIVRGLLQATVLQRQGQEAGRDYLLLVVYILFCQTAFTAAKHMVPLKMLYHAARDNCDIKCQEVFIQKEI